MAYRNRELYPPLGGVTNREILTEVYGLDPCVSILGLRPGRQVFNRQKIGIQRYMAASVAVVKMFNRLAQRWLAIRKHNFGIMLTDEGAKIALALFEKLKKSSS
jgi:hypothetical protein